MGTTFGATARLAGAASWLSRGFLALELVSLAATAGLLVIYGPEMRAGLENEKARVIDEENRAFCSKLGAGPESRRYTECAAGLSEIRARQDQRSADLF